MHVLEADGLVGAAGVVRSEVLGIQHAVLVWGIRLRSSGFRVQYRYRVKGLGCKM